jgi:hypothetical protein
MGTLPPQNRRLHHHARAPPTPCNLKHMRHTPRSRERHARVRWCKVVWHVWRAVDGVSGAEAGSCFSFLPFSSTFSLLCSLPLCARLLQERDQYISFIPTASYPLPSSAPCAPSLRMSSTSLTPSGSASRPSLRYRYCFSARRL